MHRSRLSVLVILAALSACSTRDASGANEAAAGELLVQDPTLVARLDMDQDATRRLPLPDACGPVAPAVQPAAAIGAQAEELARQGYDAEAHGNVQEAHALLRRASELDGTNKSAAYHLGRTSEALGDRVAAITSYCRYLTLTPTSTESVEARERVVRLSQPETRVAAAAATTVGDSAQTVRRARPTTAPRATVRPATVRPVTARPVVGARPTVRPQLVASVAGAQSVPAPSPERVAPSASATAAGPVDTSPSVPETGAPAVEGAAAHATERAGDGATAAGEVVVAPRAIPAVDQPATASGTGRRGPSAAQSAGIGAATGAIIGAVTGRGVKGALIGAAAGGMFGGAIGASRPVGRGIVPIGRGPLPIGRGIRP